MDSTERFSSRVDAYLRARPRYPDALARVLADEFELAADAIVADIGSGTGLSCLPFLRAGFRVFGVEPNAPMRAASADALAEYRNFEARDGTAEATGIAAGSCDLVVAGQAFHWFRHAEFRREVMRILKPGGWLALFWNHRRHSATSFMTEYNELLLEFCPEYRANWNVSDIRTKHAAAMDLVFGGGHHWSDASLDNSQTLDRVGLIERVESDSYAPAPDDPAHAPMIEALHRLFDRHENSGKVEMLYQTRLFFGCPQPDTTSNRESHAHIH
jgi:SAM-dependent methyltransferase